MKTRPAEKHEATRIAQVIRRSIVELCVADHANDPAILTLWLENKTPQTVEKWIGLMGENLILAVENDQILGVGGISREGEINLNYVSPDARFRGVSSVILGQLETICLSSGHQTCNLESTKTANRFYTHRGYLKSGPNGQKFGLTYTPMAKVLSYK